MVRNVPKMFEPFRRTPVSETWLKATEIKLGDFLARHPLVRAAPSTVYRNFWLDRKIVIWGSALATMAIILFSGASAYAETSLPGSALYGLKLVNERLRRSLANKPLERLRISLWQADRRLREMEKLIDQLTPEKVALVQEALDGFDRSLVTVNDQIKGLPQDQLAAEITLATQKALLIHSEHLLDLAERSSQVDSQLSQASAMIGGVSDHLGNEILNDELELLNDITGEIDRD